MAHTIKCGCAACGCMIENELGAPEFCNDHCETRCGVGQDASNCGCGHPDCGASRELGSGPTPTKQSG